MGPPPPRELTGEEAALYDRQIRLWGLEAQRKLASSNVLLVGRVCSALGHELGKNVVLSGVASLKLCEQGGATASFLGVDTAATAQALSEMNPHVEVSVIDKMPEQLDGFRVVCAIGMTRKMEMDISERCRKEGVMFMAGRCVGNVGWLFLDLGERYEFEMKKKKDAKDSDEQAVRTQVEIKFCSYAQAVKADWGGENKRKAFGWHVVSALMDFEARHGNMPGEGEEGKVKEIYGELCEKKGASYRWEEMVEKAAKSARYELQAVAAIVGGMWGREVVKVASGRDEPLNNLFFFEGYGNLGTVQTVGD